MTRLDRFLVDKLIHEGEDVMNIIIQRLTKKRVSLVSIRILAKRMNGAGKVSHVLVDDRAMQLN